jgi:hypothetical protein
VNAAIDALATECIAPNGMQLPYAPMNRKQAPVERLSQQRDGQKAGGRDAGNKSTVTAS